jgi:hypothetical protein
LKPKKRLAKPKKHQRNGIIQNITTSKVGRTTSQATENMEDSSNKEFLVVREIEIAMENFAGNPDFLRFYNRHNRELLLQHFLLIAAAGDEVWRMNQEKRINISDQRDLMFLKYVEWLNKFSFEFPEILKPMEVPDNWWRFMLLAYERKPVTGKSLWRKFKEDTRNPILSSFNCHWVEPNVAAGETLEQVFRRVRLGVWIDMGRREDEFLPEGSWIPKQWYAWRYCSFPGKKFRSFDGKLPSLNGSGMVGQRHIQQQQQQHQHQQHSGDVGRGDGTGGCEITSPNKSSLSNGARGGASLAMGGGAEEGEGSGGGGGAWHGPSTSLPVQAATDVAGNGIGIGIGIPGGSGGSSPTSDSMPFGHENQLHYHPEANGGDVPAEMNRMDAEVGEDDRHNLAREEHNEILDVGGNAVLQNGGHSQLQQHQQHHQQHHQQQQSSASSSSSSSVPRTGHRQLSASVDSRLASITSSLVRASAAVANANASSNVNVYSLSVLSGHGGGGGGVGSSQGQQLQNQGGHGHVHMHHHHQQQQQQQQQHDMQQQRDHEEELLVQTYLADVQAYVAQMHRLEKAVTLAESFGDTEKAIGFKRQLYEHVQLAPPSKRGQPPIGTDEDL